MSRHEIDQHDLASERLDDLVADDCLARVVAALDHDRRLDALDRCERRYAKRFEESQCWKSPASGLIRRETKN